MRDATSTGLLEELSTKRSRWRLAPLLLAIVVALLAANWSKMPQAGQITATIIVAIVVVAAHQFDVVRKSTVLMYDMDGDAEKRFEQLLAAITNLSQARRLWHISSRAEVLDAKYHAGASSTIKRTTTLVRVGSAPMVKCNVDVPVVSVGRQQLCFFPDRLLVFDSGSVGAVGYQDLALERYAIRFIEEDGVPSDSRVVDQTWRYVNKKGGPDRRFKDNRELPICEYEALHFRSSTGLNELLHVSLIGAGEPLARFLSSRGV